ncbi:hypothetical protein HGA91_00265 [candidate division WWE3 bacterium]|nr:hypothetical protein [candidate division WWE3 bacterium]
MSNRSPRRNGPGFVIGELWNRFWREVGRWLRNESTDDLLESVRDKAKGAEDSAYWAGVELSKSQEAFAEDVARQVQYLDQLKARREKAVENEDLETAMALDQEIQMHQPIVEGLLRDLESVASQANIKAIMLRNINAARLKAAQANGYKIRIAANEAKAGLASLQEQMAGIGQGNDFWELEELQDRADDGRRDADARLRMSSAVMEAGLAPGGALSLGEMSPELTALIAKKKAGQAGPATADGAATTRLTPEK